MCSDSFNLATVWVASGPPGAGKSTVADIILSLIKPTPALVGKDTLYGPFEEAILLSNGRSLGEREGLWYEDHIKKHAYSGLTATASEIRSKGCSVVLSAPFTDQIYSPEKWQKFVDELGGGNVKLVFVKSDAETLRKRLEARGLSRDRKKLENFNDFIKDIDINFLPSVSYFEIDNRLGATKDLLGQLKELLNNKSSQF